LVSSARLDPHPETEGAPHNGYVVKKTNRLEVLSAIVVPFACQRGHRTGMVGYIEAMNIARDF
jgi:hypothetical protein